MAISFAGSSTDSITTSLTSHGSQRTYAFWAYRLGAGGGNLGRIFEKRTTGAQVELLFDDVDGVGTNAFFFERDWTIGDAHAGIATPTNNEWHHYVVTYDDSSTSNLPVWYVDGAVGTIIDSATPVSGPVLTNTDAYVIGNRTSTANRNYNGYIAEFAIWDRILSADEIAGLGKGMSPDFFFRSLVLYTDLVRDKKDLKNNTALTVSGTSVVDHPRVIYPSFSKIGFGPVPAPAGNIAWLRA